MGAEKVKIRIKTPVWLRILRIMVDNEYKSIARYCCLAQTSEATVRVCMSRFKRFGWITVTKSGRGIRSLFLTAKGRQMIHATRIVGCDFDELP